MISIPGDSLEERFPLGDGVVDTAACIACPYCGAQVEITLDPGGGSTQRYVEDCEVCCRPWQLTIRWDPSGSATAEAHTDEE